MSMNLTRTDERQIQVQTMVALTSVGRTLVVPGSTRLEALPPDVAFVWVVEAATDRALGVLIRSLMANDDKARLILGPLSRGKR